MNLRYELIPFLEKSFGYVKKIKQKGLRYWFPRPDMDEAALCDRIVLIQKAILKIDTPTNIISNYDKTIYNVRTRNTPINRYQRHAFGEYIHW
jgi:hypothetical protein